MSIKTRVAIGNAGEWLNGPDLQGNSGRATFAITGAVTSIWELPSGPERVHRAHVIPLEAASIGPAPRDQAMRMKVPMYAEIGKAQHSFDQCVA